MKKTNRNMLNELDHVLSGINSRKNIEARSMHTISSVINLIESLEEEFSSEELAELEKKIHLSIKNRNPKNFTKTLQKIEERKKSGE